MKENDIESEKKATLCLSLIQEKLKTIERARTALDSKIGFLFGFVGTISVIILSFLKEDRSLVGYNLFTAGLLLLFFTLVLLVIASRPMSFLDPPDFKYFYIDPIMDQSFKTLLDQITSTMIEAYNNNYEVLQFRARYYMMSLYCFIFCILFLFLGILKR